MNLKCNHYTRLNEMVTTFDPFTTIAFYLYHITISYIFKPFYVQKLNLVFLFKFLILFKIVVHFLMQNIS